MVKTIPEYKTETSTFLQRQKQINLGDRIKTKNHREGTVVRVDRDEKGAFLVVRLDTLPHEFVYELDELVKA